MKFQVFEVRKNSQRLLQLCRVWFSFRFRSCSSFNGGTLFSGLLLLQPLCLLSWLMRLSAVALVMLFLGDFFGVRDVSWISHRSNTKLPMCEARSGCLPNR